MEYEIRFYYPIEEYDNKLEKLKNIESFNIVLFANKMPKIKNDLI